MTPQQERRKKTIAALTTVGVNVFILLVMIFFAAWRTPGSGPGDYPGIEVNLGYDEQGSGEIEPATPIGTEEATDVENPPADPEEKQEDQSATPASAEEDANVKPLDEGTLTDPNSDVEIKEEKKVEKPAEKTPEKKPIEKVETRVEKKIEEKPKVVDSKAVYKGKTTSTPANAADGDGKQGTAGNQGDDANKGGNKGVPDGTPGANVYKGTPGGGDGGPALDIYGWNWDNIPKVAAPSTEEPGRIVYNIEIDENGELIKYQKESGAVSPAMERLCVDALSGLTFTKKEGAKVPAISKGKITFVVRSK